jgi:hypothetical protein
MSSGGNNARRIRRMIGYRVFIFVFLAFFRG